MENRPGENLDAATEEKTSNIKMAIKPDAENLANDQIDSPNNSREEPPKLVPPPMEMLSALKPEFSSGSDQMEDSVEESDMERTR